MSCFLFWEARRILRRYAKLGKEKLYVCDPEKNTECEKTFCGHRDGGCYLTNKKECRAGLRRYLP